MEVKTIKEGILIPRRILKELGIENFEVLTRQHEILIRPRTSTRKHYGFVGAEKINEEFVCHWNRIGLKEEKVKLSEEIYNANKDKARGRNFKRDKRLT